MSSTLQKIQSKLNEQKAQEEAPTLTGDRCIGSLRRNLLSTRDYKRHLRENAPEQIEERKSKAQSQKDKRARKRRANKRVDPKLSRLMKVAAKKQGKGNRSKAAKMAAKTRKMYNSARIEYDLALQEMDDEMRTEFEAALEEMSNDDLNTLIEALDFDEALPGDPIEEHEVPEDLVQEEEDEEEEPEPEICDACWGTGRVGSDAGRGKGRRCRACKGTGEIVIREAREKPVSEEQQASSTGGDRVVGDQPQQPSGGAPTKKCTCGGEVDQGEENPIQGRDKLKDPVPGQQVTGVDPAPNATGKVQNA